MSFTPRARGLLLIGLAGLAGGLLLRQEAAALSGLMIVIWIGLEWINFRRRTLSILNRPPLARRRVDGQPRDRTVAATGQRLRVEIEIMPPQALSGLDCRLEDVVPGGCAVVVGSPALTVDVRYTPHLKLSYELQPSVTGVKELPGLDLKVSDPQGLFRLRRFVPLRHELTVLPFIVRPQPTVSVLKPENVQLLSGTHRHRRPGFSTELLGIRDYRAGDPPRSIAWKATARLGRLMTCEYESEVPIRATILADLSAYQYAGRPGPSRADGVIAATASVARLLMSDHDPVAAVLVSGGEFSWLTHGLGERHLTRLLLRLLSAPPAPSAADIALSELTRLTWECASRRHPELLDPIANSPYPAGVPFLRHRRGARLRRRLSFALAEVFSGATNLPARLRVDDALYREHCLRLLDGCPGAAIAWQTQFDPTDRRELARKSTDSLARGLLTGVARASDNELFVLVASVPDETAARDALERAVHAARARFHRVMFIDVGPETPRAAVDDELARTMFAASRERSAAAFAKFAASLTRLGGKFARLDDPELMSRIAAEIELLRSGRSRSAPTPQSVPGATAARGRA